MTSSMTPDEVHQMGLEQVADISSRADALPAAARAAAQARP
jgi:uncharacterized protein (DUF885 family)